MHRRVPVRSRPSVHHYRLLSRILLLQHPEIRLDLLPAHHHILTPQQHEKDTSTFRGAPGDILPFVRRGTLNEHVSALQNS